MKFFEEEIVYGIIIMVNICLVCIIASRSPCIHTAERPLSEMESIFASLCRLDI